MEITEYLKLSQDEKIKYIKSIKKLNNNGKFQIYPHNYNPIIRCIETGLEFVFIPEGAYIRGFTEQEQLYAERIDDYVNANYNEMRPTMKMTVENFLVTRFPVLNKFASNYVTMPSKGEDMYPAFLKKGEVDYICTKCDLRLATETEWEYFARAGKNDLFPFGNELPTDEELEKWLSLDFGSSSYMNCNKLGIYGIFTGEWCADLFKQTYDSKQKMEDVYTVRGGGALFWPWQDSGEWVWCMSSIRMPSTDLLDEQQCGFRLVYDI